MKPPFRYGASLLLGIAFSASALAQMNSREANRIEHGKITKNEAQHLVQNTYPGANIRKCELRRSKGHAVWVLEVMKAGDRQVTQVEVDGQTGQISTPTK